MKHVEHSRFTFDILLADTVDEYAFTFLCITYICFMLIEKALGSPCAEDNQCKDSNAVCSSHICNCSANYYNDNGRTCQLSKHFNFYEFYQSKLQLIIEVRLRCESKYMK